MRVSQRVPEPRFVPQVPRGPSWNRVGSLFMRSRKVSLRDISGSCSWLRVLKIWQCI